MKRDWVVYADDILESIAKIREYTREMDAKAFSGDSQVQDAVLRRLEIIGEAVKNIPESAKAKRPNIPWKQIAGLRDIITHAYFGVNPDRVWFVIREQLAELEHAVQETRKELKKAEGQ